MSDSKDLVAALEAPMEFQFREQSVNGYGANMVAYIDARQARRRLDDVFGPGKWRSEYFERTIQVTLTNPKDKKDKHRANVPLLFCRVSAKIDDEWVHREDLGTESNTEPEKGLASDAFKRACVMWGIGSFLYNIKEIQLPSTQNMKYNFNTRKYDTPDEYQAGGKTVKKYVPAAVKGDFNTALLNKADVNAFSMLVYLVGTKEAAHLWTSTDNKAVRLQLPATVQARLSVPETQNEMTLLYGEEDAQKLAKGFLPKGAEAANLKQLTTYTESAQKLMLIKRLENGYKNGAEPLKIEIEQRLEAAVGSSDFPTLTQISSANPVLKLGLDKLTKILG